MRSFDACREAAALREMHLQIIDPLVGEESGDRLLEIRSRAEVGVLHPVRPVEGPHRWY